MSPTSLMAICVIAGTFLVGLAMVLRHLVAAHLVQSQADQLRSDLEAKQEVLRATTQRALDDLARDLGNEKAKLTQLANRVR